MFSKIGTGELILILVIALFVIGPNKLPGVAKSIGKVLGSAQKYLKDITSEVQAEIQEVEKTVKETKEDLKETQQTINEAPQQLQKETTSAQAGDTSAPSAQEKVIADA